MSDDASPKQILKMTHNLSVQMEHDIKVIKGVVIAWFALTIIAGIACVMMMAENELKASKIEQNLKASGWYTEGR